MEREKYWIRMDYFTVMIKIYKCLRPAFETFVCIRAHGILLHAGNDQAIHLKDIFKNHIVQNFCKAFKVTGGLYIKIKFHKLKR